MKRLLFIGFMILPFAAFADNAPPAQDASALVATAPCTRGPATVKLAGIDLDTMRCQLAIAKQQLGQLIDDQAQILMLQNDLAAAQAQVTDLNKKLTDATAKPKAP